MHSSLEGALEPCTIPELEGRKQISDNLLVLANVHNVQDDGKRVIVETWTRGTGLLITYDGFVLTQMHVALDCFFDQYKREFPGQSLDFNSERDYGLGGLNSVINMAGKDYPVCPDFLATDPQHDLAIIRAGFSGERSPVKYLVSNRAVELGEPVQMHTCPLSEGALLEFTFKGIAIPDVKVFDGRVRACHYDVNNPLYPLRDGILTDLKGIKGWSGSIATNERSEIIGAYSCAMPLNQFLAWLTDGHTRKGALFMRISYARALARAAAHELDTKGSCMRVFSENELGRFL